MEQRTLRLGDVVDDYCPRERRVTNHAIVAIVGDAIRQTRCTTCDADHLYKGGREPKRRKKDSTDALYGQVLSEVTGQLVTPRAASEPAPSETSPARSAAEADPRPAPVAAAAPALVDDVGENEDVAESSTPSEPRQDGWWPGHRQLIRATLPRTDADPPPPRPIPEFTMHQRQGQGRGRGFGHGHGWSGNSNASGNGHHANGNPGNPNRDGNSWSGRSGHGGGQGQGPGQPREGGGRGRRRHRHRSTKPR